MANERRHPRPKRVLLFLVLALLLALLLEMNRWLPGGWPGGGESSGFRALNVAEGTDPADLRTPRAPGTDLRPDQGVRIEVRAADGSAAKGWRAAVGGTSAFDAPAPDTASLDLRDKTVLREGVRITWPGGQVRH